MDGKTVIDSWYGARDYGVNGYVPNKMEGKETYVDTKKVVIEAFRNTKDGRTKFWYDNLFSKATNYSTTSIRFKIDTDSPGTEALEILKRVSNLVHNDGRGGTGTDMYGNDIGGPDMHYIFSDMGVMQLTLEPYDGGKNIGVNFVNGDIAAALAKRPLPEGPHWCLAVLCGITERLTLSMFGKTD